MRAPGLRSCALAVVVVVPNIYKFVGCNIYMAEKKKGERKELEIKEIEITHTPLKSEIVDLLLESLLKRRAELFTRLA